MLKGDKLIALVFSIGLHLGLLALLLLSNFDIKTPETKGQAIQAQIMDMDEFMKNKPPSKKQSEQKKPAPKQPEEKPVEKKPEPKKPEPKKPEPKQPEVKKPEIKKPEKKPPVKPKIDEQKRLQQKKQQEERQKKLEEIRKKRQENQEKIKQQQARLKALEDEKNNTQSQSQTTTPQPGNENAESENNALKGRYASAIKNAVSGEWSRPASARAGLRCKITVKQIPGGGVIDVSIGSPCNADTVTRNSIINAVKKADPLPYTGFESVFDRDINFTFEYDGE